MLRCIFIYVRSNSSLVNKTKCSVIDKRFVHITPKQSRVIQNLVKGNIVFNYVAFEKSCSQFFLQDFHSFQHFFFQNKTR